LKTTNTSNRTQVKRGRARAVNDIDIAKQIIDDSLLCHVARLQARSQASEDKYDNEKVGQDLFPNVTPTCHWRDGDRIYWHGHAKAANVVASLARDVCINIAQLDGLVLARSAFHHSVNYRSVTIFGRPNIVDDAEEKTIQLKNFLDKISPQRWEQLRPIKSSEINMTAIAWLPLNELSIKVRAEGVNDDKADMDWPVWAGTVPIHKQFGVKHCESSDILKKAKPEQKREPNLPDVFKWIRMR
jgi:nitroimidazol reductase NimA-like FMN-containing flavoprotein (pyridoxamine 5'-phosphate oxidase superfamily)